LRGNSRYTKFFDILELIEVVKSKEEYTRV
jgi:hypothetical protein